MILYIIISLIFISAFSLIGVFLLYKNEIDETLLKAIISVSTGTLLGSAFLHLLPESLEFVNSTSIFKILLYTFIAFFFLEKFIHFHHSHNTNKKQAIGYLNLFSDFFHNFLDGIVIATAFVTDINLGIATTVAIAFHEIPQEISDISILIYSGISKVKAIFLNFLVALSSILGGLIGYFYLAQSQTVVGYLLPISAGGLIYIAMSDLLPELKKEHNIKTSLKTFVLFLLGVILMFFL